MAGLGRTPRKLCPVTAAEWDVERPPYLRDQHWLAVEAEFGRLRRSLDADDGSQALSDIKCVVESVAKIVLDINGTPAGSAESFDSVVNKAHSLLKGQPGGGELANDSVFGQMATQASKIARNLGDIRNQFGGGHGRAHVPHLSDEMMRLSLDGGLLWARWALRRLGYFTEGRPTALIEDLAGDTVAIFRSGDLRRRLLAANLVALEPHHQRAIGVAVGQRAAQRTFVVYRDGVRACLESDDLDVWPQDYRIGLANGLWFDRDGIVTMTADTAKDAVLALDPISDCAEELATLVAGIDEAYARRPVPDWDEDAFGVARWIYDRAAERPEGERDALRRLSELVSPYLRMQHEQGS